MEGGTGLDYDRKSAVKEFDDSKAGVQGLIENGVTKVPQMFYCQQSNINDSSVNESNSK
ncbi:1-aminocyclopropane-1-carboxylate oxidase-like protein, partial [Trifolium pratense]